MSPRIKVSPTTGQIVVWEPERTPRAPWFAIHAPDRNPGDASQFLFTDEDVKGWPDWVPVTWREYSYFARDVAHGLHIAHEGNLWEVAANQADGMVNRLELHGRREPLILNGYTTVRVLLPQLGI